jgi:hypothetical protein
MVENKSLKTFEIGFEPVISTPSTVKYAIYSDFEFEPMRFFKTDHNFHESFL